MVSAFGILGALVRPYSQNPIFNIIMTYYNYRKVPVTSSKSGGGGGGVKKRNCLGFGNYKGKLLVMDEQRPESQTKYRTVGSIKQLGTPSFRIWMVFILSKNN